MNFVLPDMEVLPMHSGASIDSHGNTSVFLVYQVQEKQHFQLTQELFLLAMMSMACVKKVPLTLKVAAMLKL